MLSFLAYLLVLSSSTFADTANVACVKLDWVCSPGCLWVGNPGQSQAIPLTKLSERNGVELWQGSLKWLLDGQNFDLRVLERREKGTSALKYLYLSVPLDSNVTTMSTGLFFTETRYTDSKTKFGLSVRCSSL